MKKISLGLFLSGAGLLPLLLIFPERARIIMALTEMLWAGCYFTVLTEEYRRKAPVATRGGVVRYEDSPAKYKLTFTIMYLIGVSMFLCFLAVTIFPKK